MADHVAAVKVEIKSGPAKVGIKDIENETKSSAARMKKALGDAVSEGFKGAKGAAKDLLNDVKSVVSAAGSILGGVGTAELVRGAIEAKAKFGDMAASIKFAGGSAKDAVGVQKQLQTQALLTAHDSMKLADAFMAIQSETGSIDYATDSIETVAYAARGAHKSLEAMTAVAGTLNEKLGITAEELPDALADVVGLSAKGGVSFEDMADKLGLIGAYAKEAGLSGREGLGQIVGMLNLADNANGSFKKGIAGVGGLLEQLSTTAGKSKIGAALGISGKDMSGNATQQIEAIMKATKGQKAGLEKAFGGEQLKLLVDLGKTYAASFESTKGTVKEKTAAGAAALQEAFTTASKSTVAWADIQTEAAAQMKETPQKIASATERLRQAFQSDQMQAAIGKVADRLPALAEFLAKVASWTVDNPGAAITAAIVGSIGKAAIGDAVGSLFKSFPGATIGVGLLAAAAAAAAAAIAEYEAAATKQEEKLDETPALIKKAQQEIATTGSVSKDTLDTLAQRRADFEGVRGAEDLSGPAKQSYAVMLAAKVMGGSQEVAANEGTRVEAQKLGKEGVSKTITDLDTVIAQAVAAKRAAGPSGPPLPPGVAAPPGAAGGSAAPQHAGVDLATMAALSGQAAGRGAADGLKGQVVQVRVVGGVGPTGGGPVTAGTAPR